MILHFVVVIGICQLKIATSNIGNDLGQVYIYALVEVGGSNEAVGTLYSLKRLQLKGSAGPCIYAMPTEHHYGLTNNEDQWCETREWLACSIALLRPVLG
jgi:hypothetical protein